MGWSCLSRQADEMLRGGGNKVAVSTMDWRTVAEQTIKAPTIDVRSKSSYLPFTQSALELQHEAGYKGSPVSSILDFFMGVLTQGDSSSIPIANKTLQARLRASHTAFPMLSVKDFTTRFLAILGTAAKAIGEADQWEERQASTPAGRNRGKQQQTQQQHPKHNDGGVPSNPKQTHHCEGCGSEVKVGGLQTCFRCAGHPDRNTSGPWANSATFKTLKARFPQHTRLVLSNKRRANGEELSENQLKAMQQQSEALRNKMGKPPKGNKKGESLYGLSSAELNNSLIPCNVFTHNLNYLNIQALFDTGATHENYVSKRVAEWVRGQEGAGSTCKLTAKERSSFSSILLGGTNTECRAEGLISCNLSFCNEKTKAEETLNCLKFRIFDSNIDVIVGLPTIRQHQLIFKLHSHFACPEKNADSSCAPAPVLQSIHLGSSPCQQPDSCCLDGDSCDSCKEKGMGDLQPWWYLSQKPHLLAIHQLCNVASKLAKESVLDGYEPNDDEIEWKDDPFDQDHSSDDPI